MAIRRNQLVPVLLLGVVLQGCDTTPRFEENFGTSVRANLSAQVLAPGAAANANPALGVDGLAAGAAHERYQRSFKEVNARANKSLVDTK